MKNLNLKELEAALSTLHTKYQSCVEGKTADYIPELSRADINDFAISVVTVNGQEIKIGNFEKEFTLQSVSKPFVYGLALATHGKDHVRTKIGVEPTGEAFNSIIELEKESHRPYNPMINSGAIATSSLIQGNTFNNRLEKVLNMFEKYCGRKLTIDEKVFESEKKTAHRNRAITHLLKHFSIIDEDNIDEVLDLYFKQCSIKAHTLDLAVMAATLASGGINPLTKERAISEDYSCDVLSLMFTCGMYDSAGEWAFEVGLPAKSGVSGGLLAVIPGVMGIAIYSPLIDEKGHSVRALKVFAELSKKFPMSVFRSHH